MKKINTYILWLEVGYDLFGLEGIDGIQVERLSRILQLNKSSFYHYFGTQENYLEELMKYHLKLADQIKLEIKEANTFDPDFLMLMVEHKDYFKVQMQLLLNKRSVLFLQTFTAAAEKYVEDIIILWAAFLEIHHCPDFVQKYYYMTRSMFFTQVTSKNINYPFLKKLALESKSLAWTMINENKLMENEHLN
jgi:AcrR family transcriptional regulator